MNQISFHFSEEFYERQDRLSQLVEEDIKNLHPDNAERRCEEAHEEYSNNLVWDRRFASAIFVMNLLILGGNLAAAFLSGSYSVISAFVDSSMDIVSSVIVYITVYLITHTNKFNYPRGRQRLELMAVISCSIFMGVANIMMIIQSVEAIVMGSVDPDANLPTLAIMGSAILIKSIVMVLCYSHGTTNSKILALDQRNDIITSIVAVCGAVLGDYYWPYADPIGAILVCTFIAISWFSNAFEQIPMVVGKRAEQEHVSRILAISISHDPRIKCLDHIMCYHVGEKALVELHVVLDEDLPLKETHDICESLQDKLNGLDFVERTFIHVDYFCDGCHDGN
uniref:ZT_dimer domain-containing protein n=1 Tax=Bursaphelenchus xylophilus TaxID=6326 RepID=A0A1I7SB84_BURXY